MSDADKLIGLGDVVMIWRGHACAIGEVFRVGQITHDWHEWSCPACGWREDIDETAATDDGVGAPLSWLKKLPPLAEEVGTERDEQLTVPA